MLINIPNTTLVRDTTTMALINRDRNGLDNYLKKRQTLMAQREEINKAKSEINSLKNDMNEIKQILKQLIVKG